MADAGGLTPGGDRGKRRLCLLLSFVSPPSRESFVTLTPPRSRSCLLPVKSGILNLVSGPDHSVPPVWCYVFLCPCVSLLIFFRDKGLGKVGRCRDGRESTSPFTTDEIFPFSFSVVPSPSSSVGNWCLFPCCCPTPLLALASSPALGHLTQRPPFSPCRPDYGRERRGQRALGL